MQKSKAFLAHLYVQARQDMVPDAKREDGSAGAVAAVAVG
jgi:hypothetical protein